MESDETVQEIAVDFTEDEKAEDETKGAQRGTARADETPTDGRGESPTGDEPFAGIRPVVVPVPERLWKPLCQSLGLDETATETVVGARLAKKIDALVQLLE